jgi:hypothetical protein
MQAVYSTAFDEEGVWSSQEADCAAAAFEHLQAPLRESNQL